MTDKRIEKAAQKVADESTRRKENSADLWSRFISNVENIPAATYDAASATIIRACEILEKKKP